MSASMNRMVRYAARMMFGTAASRVLGLVREMLIAAVFGATRQLDAFFVSYTIANLARQLLAEGALSASFVPVFARTLESGGADRARSLAQQAMSVIMVACCAVIALGVLCAPLIVAVMAPGFSDDERVLAISLTRYMLPILLIVSVAALGMGVLNSLDSFFVPAIAPAASNLAFIAIVLFYYNTPSLGVMVAAVLVGGFLNMLVQWGWCAKMGVLLVPAVPRRNNKELRQMMALFLPYAAGLSLNQLNPLIGRMLGSFLEGGAISALNYADRVLQLPLGLFVIAISQAVLPMLSKLRPEVREEFRDFLRDALRFNLFAVLPVGIAMFLYSPEIVHILFVRGMFGEWAWQTTSGALAMYGIGLPGMACTTVIMRALYARSMPSAAVKITAFTVFSNLAAGAILMQFFSSNGLAMGTSLAFTGSSVVGALMIGRSLGMRLGVLERVWLGRQAASCGVFAAAILTYRLVLPYPVAGELLLRAGWLGGSALLGVSVYVGATLLFRCPEWKWVRG